MAANYGAHEVMELHEVLSCEINGINHFQMYRSQVQCQHLSHILDNQLNFMMQEYNQLIQTMQGQGAGSAVPYRAPKNMSPQYGLHQPGPQSPNASAQALDDHDIASGMLCHHKSSAIGKMHAAIECADPTLRRAMEQSAVNCSEQAYEVFSYMNQKGYYQVPTMKEMTTQTMIQSYSPMGGGMMGQGMGQSMQMSGMRHGGMSSGMGHSSMNSGMQSAGMGGHQLGQSTSSQLQQQLNQSAQHGMSPMNQQGSTQYQ